MSGHSKWNNIKRKKEKTDAAKAKIFTKMGREISVIVKTGGANPNENSPFGVQEIPSRLFAETPFVPTQPLDTKFICQPCSPAENP